MDIIKWFHFRRQKNMARRKTKQEIQIDSVEKGETDHSGGEITDYEDDIREYTEEEGEDEGDEPNAQGEDASFLLFLSQYGNGPIVKGNDNDERSETEKERKDTSVSETKDTRADKKLPVKAVKDSAVGG